MKDWWYKLRILEWLLTDAYRQWRDNVRDYDLDSVECCGGRDCLCGGMTVREAWSPPSQIHRPPNDQVDRARSDTVERFVAHSEVEHSG